MLLGMNAAPKDIVGDEEKLRLMDIVGEKERDIVALAVAESEDVADELGLAPKERDAVAEPVTV